VSNKGDKSEYYFNPVDQESCIVLLRNCTLNQNLSNEFRELFIDRIFRK
jgi:hypothetical protein